MKSLTVQIAARLQQKKFCVVFETDLAPIWPLDPSPMLARNEAIQAFAKSQGLTAKISDPGIRVTFRRIEA